MNHVITTLGTNAGTYAPGTYAPDFELPGVDGQVHHLARYLDQFRAIVLVFLNQGSPQAPTVVAALNDFQRHWQPQGITVIAINAELPTQPHPQWLVAMTQFAQHHQIQFPYLRDMAQEVAQTLGVQCHPGQPIDVGTAVCAAACAEVFIIDQHWVLRDRRFLAIGDKPEAALEPLCQILTNF